MRKQTGSCPPVGGLAVERDLFILKQPGGGLNGVWCAADLLRGPPLSALVRRCSSALSRSCSRASDHNGAMDLLRERELLDVAMEEARIGLKEGGIPIGAALYSADGILLGRGHNRRVQDGDPSMHAETAAFRAAGRQRTYRGTTMVTTLSPCWYCCGLVRQFGISRVVIGEAKTFKGGQDWLADHGVEIVVLDDPVCAAMMRDFIEARPELWHEDIGE